MWTETHTKDTQSEVYRRGPLVFTVITATVHSAFFLAKPLALHFKTGLSSCVSRTHCEYQSWFFTQRLLSLLKCNTINAFQGRTLNLCTVVPSWVIVMPSHSPRRAAFHPDFECGHFGAATKTRAFCHAWDRHVVRTSSSSWSINCPLGSKFLASPFLGSLHKQGHITIHTRCESIS